jgi:hypothetical protein
METLIDLQNRIYEQNKALGWHDKPRSFNTYVCLFHSELSEAVEGLRKNLMDDHLPSYPMAAVELADFVIRVLDWFGAQDDIDVTQMVTVQMGGYDNLDYIANIHRHISAAMYWDGHKLNRDKLAGSLDLSISMANSMAQSNDWDLLQIINEKTAYNMQRADHKRENRAKENGKKF